jgi:hypothetical protein
MNVGGAEEMVPIALRVTTIFRRDRRESPSVYMHLLPDHAERNAAKVERFLNGATVTTTNTLEALWVRRGYGFGGLWPLAAPSCECAGRAGRRPIVDSRTRESAVWRASLKSG